MAFRSEVFGLALFTLLQVSLLNVPNVQSGQTLSRSNSFPGASNSGGNFGGNRYGPSRSGSLRATSPPPPVDPALMQLSEDLFKLDQANNAAKQNIDWKVNTYSTTGRLFTKFNALLMSKPTYNKLRALLDNYNAVLGRPESVTPQELNEQSSFLDAIIATPVMQKAWDFLKGRGVAPSNKSDFKKLLQRIWFTVYKRRGQPDTSGFEHVFVGEIDGAGPDAPVSGFHNWVQYYLEESAGRATFERWKGQTEVKPSVFGVQFKWNGHLKIKSTMAIGESPEMSIAVLTSCFLLVPNNECKLKMASVPVSVITHRWDTRDPQEFYVASAYYDN